MLLSPFVFGGPCYASDVRDAAPPFISDRPRHAAFVRVTHWITALCFFALLVSGVEILISHPRFYWGETGNNLTPTLFKIPIPASRRLVPTGYNYTLPDQNGWSRSLHFQAAWAAVLTGLLYVIWGFWTGHFQSNLFPAPNRRSWGAIREILASHVRFRRPDTSEAYSYNVVQRAAYLGVIFLLFPLVIWTGLAMSPSFNAAFPIAVNSLGGRQSARTIHFFVSIFLFSFLIVHVAMIFLAGFMRRMRAMILGGEVGESVSGRAEAIANAEQPAAEAGL